MITASLCMTHLFMISVVEVLGVFYSSPDPLFLFYSTECFVYLRCTYFSIPAAET